jgi:hypothetical protein
MDIHRDDEDLARGGVVTYRPALWMASIAAGALLAVLLG